MNPIDATRPMNERAVLTCKFHPQMRWTTKNIDFIGARTIFYATPELGHECNCSSRFLEVVEHAE